MIWTILIKQKTVNGLSRKLIIYSDNLLNYVTQKSEFCYGNTENNKTEKCMNEIVWIYYGETHEKRKTRKIR